jgi:alcohol dehydrogenase
MRSARLHEPGQPLRIDTVEIPEPRPRDVLVRVKACGIIPNMNAIFSGRLWNHLPPLPASVGLDAAGVIAEVGSEVTDVAVGDRVYVNPWLSCGMCSYCRAGELMLCSAAAFQGYFGFFLIRRVSSWIIRLAVFRSTSLHPRSGWCICRRE